MKVLIIEPDHILGQAYKKAFTEAGIAIKIASNAQGAIATIDETKPDVVVLEIQMASHSGVEFLHEFRSYEDLNDIPIVMYSSVPEYAFGIDTKTWNNLGVVRYFYKPKTNLNQLIGAVKSIVE
mgnify:CR=1 FL=1